MTTNDATSSEQRSEQYTTAANLNARIQLHARFSTNPYGWFRWVLDKLPLSSACTVLDVGSGPGTMWQQNMPRLPAAWHVRLLDSSPGMLVQACTSLTDPRFGFAVADAQALPFTGNSFDVVMANHMLYHVPDRARALAEMRRVLKPDAAFYAATVGALHMQELESLLHRFDLSLSIWGGDFAPTHLAFTLENGAEQLAPFFSHIEVHRYPDSLAVTEAAPLVDYVASLGVGLAGERRAEFGRFVQAEIGERGRIDITKVSGMFIARG